MNDIVLHFLISRPQDTYELEQQEKLQLLLEQSQPSLSLCSHIMESQLCVSSTTADAFVASLCAGETRHLTLELVFQREKVRK